jgi:hypothetical protein
LALHYEARFLRSPDSVRRSLTAFEGIVGRFSLTPSDAAATPIRSPSVRKSSKLGA